MESTPVSPAISPKLSAAHPPAPSHALTVQKRIAYRHGRGRKLYSLIPKGEALPPPL